MAKATGKKLVIVESPTKAKTIRKFLGKEFMVDSCMGHIRDLAEPKNLPEKIKKDPKWSKFAVNTDTFQPFYVVNERKIKVVKELREKLEGADELYLATDEDREGESISWHLLEVLKPTVPVKRMVFNEITKEAIQSALTETRQIDKHLVEAQETRRVLDRMVGYGISPLLWKKIAFGLSAGRVQSVAVKLVADRELDRMKFKRSEYWGITGHHKKDAVDFETRLVSYQNKRVAVGKDFDPLTGNLTSEKAGEVPLHMDEGKAQKISAELSKASWTVTDIEEKPQFRKPAAPFITSTLQQEASR
ncbi:MAG: DNA topoisomerase I, partial [Bdellovibrionales bacterium]|nr:DNA topoisomerase I [Bdellovibrionales bacterium]